MGDEKLAMRAYAQKVDGERRERGLKLRCGLLQRDLEREELRKTATDRRNWRLLIEIVEREK